jgi:hypothetical protein
VIVALALASSAAAQQRSVDQDRLAALLTERGFTPPPDFKALVVRVDAEDDGSLSETFFDYAGTADDRDDWWPASSVKIYAAVAAYERIHELGFGGDAWLTYEYDDGPVTLRLDQIVSQALEQSSNAAFDRLVELVGFDSMNTDFFTPENGFEDTVFLRAYSGRHIDEETQNGINRFSPRIVIRRGPRRHVLPARVGRGQYLCPDQGNCTTLLELAEVMSRIMLHEELPEETRYHLTSQDLTVMRRALAAAQNREIAEIVTNAFGEIPVRVYHKPGFANEWVSDVLFIHRTDTNERWVVAMAARPGRRALDGAAETIGTILASGALR